MTLQMNYSGLHTLISGGQTGADQGGLLAAWRMGVKTGGQAPACYKIQGGHNPLLEILGLTAAGDFASRTRVNIKSSDGTVIIANDLNSPGMVLTRSSAKLFEKPFLQLEISNLVRLSLLGPRNGTDQVLDEIMQLGHVLKDFIILHRIGTLNVAGNRELQHTGTPYGTLVITSIADWVVGLALDLLEIDDLLIFKKDLV
jgi:hypothetical protein